jgi:hypothetical protein
VNRQRAKDVETPMSPDPERPASPAASGDAWMRRVGWAGAAVLIVSLLAACVAHETGYEPAYAENAKSAPMLRTNALASDSFTQDAGPPQPGAPADRQIIRSADLSLEVDDVSAGRTAAEVAVTAHGGFVESVYESRDSLRLQLRVPADRLDAFLAQLSGLGKVTEASVYSMDVTEQHADLEVRLANSRKLRDRLQQLLEKATTVEEMLSVEKELARVQSEVERLQGQLDRLNGQVSMSAVSLTLKPTRILGPLGYVGYGIWWVVEKLFVIR